MAKSCAIIPKVLNNKTKLTEDSKLFKDLLSMTTREEAVRIYLITKSAKFLTDFVPKLKLDDRGEPTIPSLLKNTNLGKVIKDADVKLLELLNRRIGGLKRGSTDYAMYPRTRQNHKMLVDRAIKFNNESEYKDDYKAIVKPIYSNEDGDSYWAIEVVPNNKQYSIETSNMEYNEVLNEKLTNILAQYGVSIGALTELEERLGVNGVTDFNQAKAVGEGLVELIRLAKGEKGQAALPEEFAHFILRAMADSPLVTRIINNIAENDLAAEILGEEFDIYNLVYSEDPHKLAEEAAGKLLAEHLFKGVAIQPKPYKSLLERLILAIKNFFKLWSYTDIEQAMITANKDMEGFANTILNNELPANLNLKDIASTDMFFNLEERVLRDKNLLQKIIDSEVKRLHIYGLRTKNADFSEKQKSFISELERQLRENNELFGINNFLVEALSTLSQLNAKLLALETSDKSLNEKSAVLRDVKNYMFSYQNLVDDIYKALVQEKRFEDNRYAASIALSLADTSNALKEMFSNYADVAKPIFYKFVEKFVSPAVLERLGKTVDDLVNASDEDISFLSRYLDSMADSNDYMLKVMDLAVKKSKNQARLRVLEVMKELQKIQLDAERAGIKDFEWMFEVVDGNKTGNYIQEINWGLYNNRKQKFLASLKEKYGENPEGDAREAYNKEAGKWFKKNRIKLEDGSYTPNPAIYKNEVYTKLNDALKEFYNKFMAIKETLDSYLPVKATRLYSAVKIRKDLVERALGSSSLKQLGQTFWESVKDDFIRRADDNTFGITPTVKDFEGREVQTLPIYYTKLNEGESPNDLSTDLVSTMTAYAAMAIDYDEMNKVIDVLELGRDILREREVTQTRAGKPLKEKFYEVGRKIETTVTKSGEQTRFMERLNDFFEMQVYGRYMKDNTLGNTNISTGKLANAINKLTSLNVYALNILSGISNVATGTVMMRTEGISGEFFNTKNITHADKEYAKALPGFLGLIGSRVKTNKLYLWNELFDVMQEYEGDIRDIKFDRKSWFSRMFGSSALFFMNNAGEHWMQTRTSLALADAYKMKDSRGNIVSLWDAMEVVSIDKEHPDAGARLQVKPGYTKEDGSEFTKEDILAFSARSKAINQKLHGIYNEADKNAFQALGIGRMAMMFRKWIVPSLNKRFLKDQYNYDLDAWQEGYYRTLGRFLIQIGKDLREGEFALAANWDNLSELDKANMKRAIGELSQFLVLLAFLGLVDWGEGKDRPWLMKQAEYQARRLRTEIGVLIPGPSMLNEGLKIMKSPAAGVNTMEKLLDLTLLLNPFNYETFGGEDAILLSGRYKGRTRAHKFFFESPLVPMNSTIYRGLHPEEGIPFFKQ